jgi:hypothetical protein
MLLRPIPRRKRATIVRITISAKKDVSSTSASLDAAGSEVANPTSESGFNNLAA